jgi:hypothetical protein
VNYDVIGNYKMEMDQYGCNIESYDMYRNIVETEYSPLYDCLANHTTHIYRYLLIEVFDIFREQAEFKHLDDNELVAAIREVGICSSSNPHGLKVLLDKYNIIVTGERVAETYGITCLICNGFAFADEDKKSVITISDYLRKKQFFPHGQSGKDFQHSLVCNKCVDDILEFFKCTHYTISKEKVRDYVKLKAIEQQMIDSLRDRFVKKEEVKLEEQLQDDEQLEDYEDPDLYDDLMKEYGEKTIEELQEILVEIARREVKRYDEAFEDNQLKRVIVDLLSGCNTLPQSIVDDLYHIKEFKKASKVSQKPRAYEGDPSAPIQPPIPPNNAAPIMGYRK